MRRKGSWFEGAFTTAIVDGLAAKQSAEHLYKAQGDFQFLQGLSGCTPKNSGFFGLLAFGLRQKRDFRRESRPAASADAPAAFGRRSSVHSSHSNRRNWTVARAFGYASLAATCNKSPRQMKHGNAGAGRIEYIKLHSNGRVVRHRQMHSEVDSLCRLKASSNR